MYKCFFLNRALLFFISIVFYIVSTSFSYAVDSPSTQPPQKNTTEQLITISNEIQDLQNKKADINKSIKTERDETAKQELESDLTKAQAQLKDYNSLFEKISLGGIDTTRFDITPQESIQQTDDYNWEKELIQIAQPVFSEMKKLTDAPRKRDLLRLEEKEIEERLALVSQGLNNLTKVDTSQLSPTTLKNFDNIKTNWINNQKELEQEQKLVLIKLDELRSHQSFTSRLSKGTWDFAKGRGLTLLVTISVISLLIFIFNRLLVILERREKNIISTKWRVFILIYQIITTLFSIMVALMILYSSGDMVLFGLAILIILAFLISSRNSIPTYFIRTRTFLNMGQTREGERVVYDSIPWKVQRINLYTVFLHNPLLENGTLRLTIDHLNSMISRPIKMDEAWFPTVVNDVVLISGSLYKVTRQTPEYVYLTSSGTELVYPSKDFISSKITNLTYGYYTGGEFTLKFRPISDKIPAMITLFKDELSDYIKANNPDAFKLIQSISLDFSRIDDHGNAEFIFGFTMGAFATDYRSSIVRLAQRGIIDICQNHNIELNTIPKIQIKNMS